MNVLIDAATIQGRIRELAAEIEGDYPAGEEIHLVCVLKGGFMFMADLVRAMSTRVSLDFIAVSSYAKSTKSSGEVRMLKDLDSGLQGRHVGIQCDRLGQLGHGGGVIAGGEESRAQQELPFRRISAA